MTRALRFPSFNTGAIPNQASGVVPSHHLGPGTPQLVSQPGAFLGSAFLASGFLVEVLAPAQGGNGRGRDFLQTNLPFRVGDSEGAVQTLVSVGIEAYATDVPSGDHDQTTSSGVLVGTASDTKSGEQDVTDSTRQGGGGGVERKDGPISQTRSRRL